MTAPVGLAGIEHIVVLMLENRSFDHMLGYLYSEIAATNAQLFGTETPAPGAKETNQGFVRNYAKAIAANRAKHWYVVPGTTPEMIMGLLRAGDIAGAERAGPQLRGV